MGRGIKKRMIDRVVTARKALKHFDILILNCLFAALRMKANNIGREHHSKNLLEKEKLSRP